MNYRKIWEEYHNEKLPTGWHVHHIIPQCKGGSHDIQNLLAVPAHIHARLHEKDRHGVGAWSGSGKCKLSGENRTEAQMTGDLKQGLTRSQLYVGSKNSMYGKTHTAETKQQMSKSNKKAMSSPKWKLDCDHCGKIMDKGNFTRYHGDKCKIKEQKYD